MWLTRLSITRPVTMLMLVLTLVILGLQSNQRLPVDLYPDISFPMISITTSYAGTGPEEMETLITKPIEDNVSTISGLKKISSTSSEGISTVMMELNLGTNVDVASSDVRSKLDALRNTLPQDAKAPVVSKMDVKALPVIQVNMASDRRGSIDVRRLADDFLKDRLSQLPGVADVTVSGGDVREIQVKVDKNRLEAYKLNIDQIVSALNNENLNLPSGTIEEAHRDYSVRMMGEFTDPAQILNVRIPVAGNPNLCVRDIAEVADTVAEPTTYTRVDGGPSVTLLVQKQSDANTVKVVDNVRAELEQLTGQPFTEASLKKQAAGKWNVAKARTATSGVQLPPDIHITTSNDQSTFIKDSLNDVYQSLIEGALLAMLIIFLFLHSLRGTLIVGLAIPTSMIATFLVMDFLGFTINMMTMMGLSLSVGILVDDSIVVIENIHRHLRMGESPRDAAINGRSEIGLAAMCITLVDVVVFVPIAFMGGIVGQFFRQFGLVVATATLFSLFISFTLTPMLASRFLKSHEEEEAEAERQREHPGLFQRFVNVWEAGYNAFDGVYRKVLSWSLDHRAVVICMGIMVMTASIGTLMDPPTSSQLSTMLPALLLGLALFLLVWYPVSIIRSSVGRFGYVVMALFISIMLIAGAVTLTGKFGASSPTLVMLLAMEMLGVIAFALTRTRDAEGAATRSGVVTPLLVVGGIFMLVVLFFPRKFNFEFAPSMDQRQLSIKIEQDVGTTLDVTDTTTRYIEKTLKANFPEIKTISTSVGSTPSNGITVSDSSADIAQLNVELKDYVPGSPTTDQVINWANDRYKMLPGVKVTASFPANGPGGAAIDVEISGDDMPRIETVAGQIYDVVRGTKGVYGADLSWREGRPEVQAHIDRDRAAQYGISVAQIASALHTSLEGDTTSKYRENGKEYDIRVSLPKAQRNIVSQVPNMVVGSTASGQPVYLYEVVRLEPAGGPTKMQRTNRQRTVTLTAQLAKGYALGNMQQLLQKQIDQLDTHGVTVYWAGQAEEMRDSTNSMLSALLLSVVLVFMLMAALFESFISPLIIWLAVPQAMAGAFFALTFTGKSLNIMSMIGIIMLVGLVTKNAILLVDYTNTLRKEHGMGRKEALLLAGPTRLRPILMTSLAMIFGMLPTAIAMSKGSEMRQPMAIAVIGGLLVALFLSLLMVPSFYIIIDNLGVRFGEVWRKLHGETTQNPPRLPAGAGRSDGTDERI